MNKQTSTLRPIQAKPPVQTPSCNKHEPNFRYLRPYPSTDGVQTELSREYTKPTDPTEPTGYVNLFSDDSPGNNSILKQKLIKIKQRTKNKLKVFHPAAANTKDESKNLHNIPASATISRTTTTIAYNSEEDDISLMPTLALGFTNSINNYDFQNQPQPKSLDNEKKNNNNTDNNSNSVRTYRKRKELRITDDGYYLSYEQEKREDEKQEPEEEKEEEGEEEEYEEKYPKEVPVTPTRPIYKQSPTSPSPLAPRRVHHDQYYYASPPISPKILNPDTSSNMNTNSDEDNKNMNNLRQEHTIINSFPLFTQLNQLFDLLNITQARYRFLILMILLMIIFYEVSNVLEIFCELLKFW